MLLYRNVSFQNKTKDYNLILISIDTLRPDHMGIYGYEKNTTPYIDKWAKNAFVFTNVVTVVPQTYPSFAALMTGLHPFESGIISSNFENTSLPLSSNVETIAKLLKKNNYQTGAFVSNVVISPNISNLNMGFDSYQMIEYGSYKDKNFRSIVEQSGKWMNNAKTNKFFLWIHLMGPHYPYNPSLNNRCIFNKNFCSYISNKSDQDIENERIDKWGCQEKGISLNRIDLMKTLYDGKIADTDDQVRGIMENISKFGLEKNSIVVIYGDHGEGFDHQYLFGHGFVLYDSEVKIPLIIKHPELSLSPKKINRLIDNTDIFPTILDLLSIPQNNLSLSGISFSDEFDTNNIFSLIFRKRRNASYLTNNYLSKFAIYDGKYKFMLSGNDICLYKNQKEELYDVINDKNELNNLTSGKKNIADKLRSQLLIKLAKYNLPNSKNIEDVQQKELERIKDRIKSLGY
ncbi:sulfatase-like hydrolase/transferase [Candidatus Roizmanbacteria bacterium]|nr:sulfatase-like hydrolase/transferase [Candidatus Roizmanbacteria bacterium]